jgi:hypothetical protein
MRLTIQRQAGTETNERNSQVLGDCATSRLILICDNRFDTRGNQSARSMPAKQFRTAACGADSETHGVPTGQSTQARHDSRQLSRVFVVRRQSLKLQPPALYALPEIGNIKDSDAEPGSPERAAKSGNRIQMTGYRRTEDTDIRHRQKPPQMFRETDQRTISGPLL